MLREEMLSKIGLTVVFASLGCIKCMSVEVLSDDDNDKADISVKVFSDDEKADKGAVLIDDLDTEGPEDPDIAKPGDHFITPPPALYEDNAENVPLIENSQDEDGTTDASNSNETTDKNESNQSNDNDANRAKLKNYANEIARGNNSEFFATNPQYNYPDKFSNLGRRNTPNTAPSTPREIKLIKAPPELVLAIDKASRLAHDKDTKPSDYPIKVGALRSGDFWDSVWEQPIDPKMLRRETNEEILQLEESTNLKANQLQSVKVRIEPEAKIHNLLMGLKKISPKLLYVMYNGHRNVLHD